MLHRLGHNTGIWLAERGRWAAARLDEVVPEARWLRWLLALLAVWAVTALSFYYVPGTKYSPSAESHVAGDWRKSAALGAAFAVGTFVWLLWRHEREKTSRG